MVRLLDASAKEERDKDVITRLRNADEIPMHHSGHEAGAKKKRSHQVWSNHSDTKVCKIILQCVKLGRILQNFHYS